MSFVTYYTKIRTAVSVHEQGAALKQNKMKQVPQGRQPYGYTASRTAVDECKMGLEEAVRFTTFQQNVRTHEKI